MLRIHFTPADLGRVRVASEPDPRWELLLSVYQLCGNHDRPVFGAWRQASRRRLPPSVIRLVSDLVPVSGSSPDAILRTPKSLLAGGDPATGTGVGDALREYFETCVEPHWPVIRSQIDQDRALRSQLATEQGTEALLRGLGPWASWQPPYLVVDYPFRHEINLADRGLTLLPTFFGSRQPVTLIDPDLPPVLAYPVAHPPGWANHADPGRRRGTGDPLAPLLGRTRSMVLRAIWAGPCTTTALASRVGSPLPTVSQHTSVLRAAGLIVTSRDRNRVLHGITALGSALLDAGQDHPAPDPDQLATALANTTSPTPTESARLSIS